MPGQGLDDRPAADGGRGANELQPKECTMRNLFLVLVPVVALTALPAFAQEATQSTTTTTTTAVPPPTTSNQSVTTKTYSNDGDSATQSEAHRSTSTDAFGQTRETQSRHDSKTNADGSHSESSETSSTGPN